MIIVVVTAGGTPLYVFVAFLVLYVVVFMIDLLLLFISKIWDEISFESNDGALELVD